QYSTGLTARPASPLKLPPPFPRRHGPMSPTRSRSSATRITSPTRPQSAPSFIACACPEQAHCSPQLAQLNPFPPQQDRLDLRHVQLRLGWQPRCDSIERLGLAPRQQFIDGALPRIVSR